MIEIKQTKEFKDWLVTFQQAFSKSGNPTLKTLAKIVHESALRK